MASSSIAGEKSVPIRQAAAHSAAIRIIAAARNGAGRVTPAFIAEYMSRRALRAETGGTRNMPLRARRG